MFGNVLWNLLKFNLECIIFGRPGLSLEKSLWDLYKDLLIMNTHNTQITGSHVIQNMDKNIIEQRISWLHRQSSFAFIYVLLKAIVT